MDEENVVRVKRCLRRACMVTLGIFCWAVSESIGRAADTGFPVAVQVMGPDEALNGAVAAGLRTRLQALDAVEFTDDEALCTMMLVVQPTTEDREHPNGCVIAVAHTNRLSIVLLQARVGAEQSSPSERETAEIVEKVFRSEEPLRYLNVAHLIDTKEEIDGVLDRFAKEFHAKQIVRTREAVQALAEKKE